MSQQQQTNHFIDTQNAFIAHLRDPSRNPAPEAIEQRRMAIYRDLIYNNVEGFISSGFPVLRDITSDTDWHAMIRDFIIKHQCRTPIFHEIAREFLAYLESERDRSNDPAFILELAHYEWVELALSLLDNNDSSESYENIESSLDDKLKTSQLAWPLSYHYPVHQIGPEFQPTEPIEHPIFLLVYRNADDQVTFMELNPVSARLIDLLNEGLTGREAAINIATELQHNSPDVVINGAQALINDWLNRGVLLPA